jgi:Tol biopolymer transport system component
VLALFALAAALAAGRAPSLAPYDSAWPQFSPDGASIVFGSTREDGDWEIFVMGADGTGAKRLTRSPGRDAHPIFARDGRSIFFQSPRGGAEGEVDLYTMAIDGSATKRLIEAPGFDGVAALSPDGRRLAYQHGTKQGEAWHWEIHLADADGRHDRALTKNAWSSQVPVFTPDAKRLVFFANPGGHDRLFSMDLATRKVIPLAPEAAARGEADDQVPSLSPDGRFVAFTSTRDGGRDLYRIEIATGTVTRLTTGFDVWSQAAWSPDGKRILFSAKAGGVEEIFSVDSGGGEAVRLTRGAEGMRPGDPRLEVEAALAEYARDLRALDAARLAAAYAPDGELLDPGMPPHQGPAAIKAFLDSFQGVVIESASMTPDSTEVWGTAALTFGRYAQRVRVGDTPAADYRGRFVVEWAKQSDGRWLIRRLLTQPSPAR